MIQDEYELIADLYDHVPLYRGRPDVPFLVEEATRNGGPVLEMGCGTGRVVIPVARAGIEIVGLDLSPRMLSVCRRILEAERDEVRTRVQLVEGDMRSFDLGRTFRLVTLPFRPFQHLLTVDDQLACLAAVRRHLAPMGRLILDVFNPSLDALVARAGSLEFVEEPEFVMPDGRKVTRRHRILAQDRFLQINDIEIVYHVRYPDGHDETLAHRFRMRYAFRFEMEHLLARAGFAVEQLFAGYDRSAYGSTYPGELVFVATAREA